MTKVNLKLLPLLLLLSLPLGLAVAEEQLPPKKKVEYPACDQSQSTAVAVAEAAVA